MNRSDDIQTLLRDSQFRFSKKYGQNFLTDEHVLDEICRDAQIQGVVLEIGTGAGTLTRMLSRYAQRVVTFEIDPRLQPVLQRTLADCPNVQVVFGDIMRYSDEQIAEMCGGSYQVVANIPYYLTSPIVMRFAEAADVRSLTLTVQYEVAQRIVARPGGKQYGALSVGVQSHGNATLTRVLGRQLFCPPPQVDSAVVRLDIDNDMWDIADRKLFRKTVQAAFSMRRKLLANCLSVGFGVDKQRATQLICGIGLDEHCRGEELSVADFVQLYQAIEAEEWR